MIRCVICGKSCPGWHGFNAWGNRTMPALSLRYANGDLPLLPSHDSCYRRFNSAVGFQLFDNGLKLL